MEFQSYTNFFYFFLENIKIPMLRKREQINKKIIIAYETPPVIGTLKSKAWTFDCPAHDKMAAFTRDVSMK